MQASGTLLAWTGGVERPCKKTCMDLIKDGAQTRGGGMGPDQTGPVRTGPDQMGGPDWSDIRGAEASHGPFFGTNEHPRRDADVILS